MKYALRIIAGFGIPALILYLIGSFAAFDLNPAAWRADGRCLIAVVEVVIGAVFTAIILPE